MNLFNNSYLSKANAVTEGKLAETFSLDNAKQAIIEKVKGDRFIWGIIILLSLMSILVVYSATGSLAYKKYHGNTEYFLFKQVGFTVIGLVLIYLIHQINYYFFSALAKYFIIIAIPLLIYTLVFGATINEGSRWIKIPIINQTFQTSDFARLALFMYLARVLSKSQDVIKSFKDGFLKAIIPVIIICGLIMPANLSNALLTGATALLIMYIGRIKFTHILLTIVTVLIPLAFIVAVAVVSYKGNQAEIEKPGTYDKVKSYGTIWNLGKKGSRFYLYFRFNIALSKTTSQYCYC